MGRFWKTGPKKPEYPYEYWKKSGGDIYFVTPTWIALTKKIPALSANTKAKNRKTCGARIAHRRCGARDGNRTRVFSLGSWHSAIELLTHLHNSVILILPDIFFKIKWCLWFLFAKRELLIKTSAYAYTITDKPITASLFCIKFSSSSHCRFNTFHWGKSISRFDFT